MKRKNNIIQSALASKIIDKNLSSVGIMDFDGLKSTVNSAKDAFPENFIHTFAVKANPLVAVLKQLRLLGMGAEVASSGELKMAVAAGFTTEQIIFDSPAKTIHELRSCIENGISLNIDNIQELARVDKLMEEMSDTKSTIGFRINPQIGSGAISSTSTATSTSKFGYALSDGTNRQKLIDIYRNRPWLTSLHTHSGSQGCSLDLMTKGVATITELAIEINAAVGSHQITQIDIGGGLPVNFSSEEVTPTFKEYADLLKLNIPRLFAGEFQVKTEFGRAIVAKNGMIITRVEYTKNSGGRHIAITHAGAQILTRTAFLPNSWPLRVTGFTADAVQKTVTEDNVRATDIAGPCCFAGDLVCSNQQLPELMPDDFVMIHDTGGYYFSNHFDYNSFPRIAVYAVTGSDEELNIVSIRKVDTLDDILKKM